MPQFFISVNHSDDFQMPEGVSIEQLHTDVMAFNEKMAAEQRIVFVGALEQPASDARLVDATSGEALVAQETASGAEIQLGGFWILEAADLDEALNLGRRPPPPVRAPSRCARCRARAEPCPLSRRGSASSSIDRSRRSPPWPQTRADCPNGPPA